MKTKGARQTKGWKGRQKVIHDRLAETNRQATGSIKEKGRKRDNLEPKRFKNDRPYEKMESEHVSYPCGQFQCPLGPNQTK